MKNLILKMAVPVYSNFGSNQYQPRPSPSNPDLEQEVKLYENARQREEFDNRANVFSIIKTIEALEKAYLKDAITPQAYTASCKRLLDQFQAAFRLVGESFHNIDEFAAKYMLHCPAAMQRIKDGKPQAVTTGGSVNMSKIVAETVSLFITIMDRLRLEIRATDELHPDVKELFFTINTMPNLPQAFEGKVKVKKWYDELESMQASDELTEEQSRQMLFDMENAYGDFTRFFSSLATN